MSRIAVTGANGFIGRFLVRRLVAQGHEVTALVRDNRAVRELPDNVTVQALGEIDCWDWFAAAHTLRHHDAVIHLAGLAHQSDARYRLHSDAYHRTNVVGSQRVAMLAATVRVPRFVLVSSVHAVATSSRHVLTESTPCRPTTIYGKSKFQSEQVVKQCLSDRATTWTIIRPPPVYGPGQPGNLQQLFSATMAGAILPIAKIRSRRSLIYVENLADALIRCALAPEAAYRTYFVSDGEPVTISQFVRQVAAASGRSARIWSVPLPLLWLAALLSGRWLQTRRLAATLVVDDRPIRYELHWSPPFSWQQGIAKTVAHHPSVGMRKAA